MSAHPPLRLREKLAYGLGDTASNFYFQAFNLFLLYYYTDVFGLSATAVGTMFLVTRIFDAVNDPLMGLLADRTRSRWGRFRPYLLWVALPYGLLGYLMFLGPQASDTGKLVYAYITYSLTMLAYTAINIPYSALMGVMSPSTKVRTALSSVRFVCAFGGGFLIASLTLPLKDWLGAGDEAAGFRATMALFAVASVALFWWTFAGTRERVAPAAAEEVSWRRDLGLLWRNRPWLVLFLVALFTLTNVAMRNGAVVYYFKYCLGAESAATLFLSLGSVGMILGAASCHGLARRFDRRRLMIGLTVGNALALAAMYLDWSDARLMLHGLNLMAAFLGGATPVLLFSFYADTADYGEWKFGRRTTGLIFAASLFATKMGIAVGGGLAGWFLDACGFVANVEQTASARHGITLLFSLLPAAFALLTAVALLFYPLTEDRMREIESDLAARRTA
ncbi:MFS transporter [Actomonas aquatica]|uniref:MFS transporter n=1 Tax=Actomonas aquatica TaxID=2866162 RepID=A0ABZ1C2L7_9BACT|nr:MFS transporter [Opitutus sp. WL0086]WRQ85825.1 MFS transporter [Opitutus sp. WL0086]